MAFALSHDITAARFQQSMLTLIGEKQQLETNLISRDASTGPSCCQTLAGRAISIASGVTSMLL